MRILLFAACLVFVSSTAPAKDVLTVADVMRDRIALDGKVVTVRGIFRHGYQGPFLLLDLDTAPDDDGQQIRLVTEGYLFHRLYGRLQRSLVLVTGEIYHFDVCESLFGGVVVSSSPCSGVNVVRFRAVKIIDTIAADDPRVRNERLRPGHRISLAPFPESDLKYAKIVALAREWREAILNGDVRALARQSDSPDYPQTEKTRLNILTDPTSYYYNVFFRGKDSLQNRLRRNEAHPIYIGFRRRDGVHAFAAPGGGDVAYAFLHICYCLRKNCGEAEKQSLENVDIYNLADPYWCFEPYEQKDGKWVIWF